MVAELLFVAIDYYRSPLLYEHFADPSYQLPKGFDILLSDFCIALGPQRIGFVARALETDTQEIQEAGLFFLRQVLLAPGADHYRVLGLSRRASQEAIRRHYSLVVRVFHPDRTSDDNGRNSAFTARINEAYATLRSPEMRRRYDKRLSYSTDAFFSDSEPEPNDFFRPRIGLSPFSAPARSRMRLPKNARSLLVWALVGFAVTVIAISVFRASTTTLLRSNTEISRESKAAPSFLRGSATVPRREIEDENLRTLLPKKSEVLDPFLGKGG